MRIRFPMVLLVFLAILIAGACAPAPESAEPTLPVSSLSVELDGSSWQLIEAVAPQETEFPGLDLRLVTLIFQNGEISGSSGCNRYFGTYTQQDSTIKFSDQIGATKMACPEIQMSLENTYFAFLAAADTLTMEDGHLILSGGGYKFAFETTN